MHFSIPTLLAAAAALIPSSMAHFCFNKLIVNGNYTPAYSYVRKNNNSNSPITDVTSTDLRCNAGGLSTGNTTSTYTVSAGSSIGFALDTAIGHPGPLQVYMSAAPDATLASEYDGSGDWFKVYGMGPANITSEGLQWAASGIQNFTFTLPTEVPAGQYLLRVEAIALHGASTVGGAQFYISCAQIEVTSTSSLTPEPMVEIPGVYTGEEPGILINIYYPVPTNYTMPGPAVWPSDNSTTTSTNGTSTTVASVSTASTAATVLTTRAAAVATTSPSTAPETPLYSIAPNSTSPSLPSSGFTTATKSLLTIAASGTASAGSVGGAVVAKYAQCGGTAWTGGTSCETGSSCVVQNEYYAQCV